MIKIIKSVIFSWLAVLMACCATANREDVSLPAELPMGKTTSPGVLEKQVFAPLLDAGVLRAYESKALSKLEDYYEYLHVISNPSYDTTFRRQAITQALALFTNDSSTPYTGLESSVLLMPVFLEELYRGKWGEVTYEISRAALRQPLEISSDTTYRGQITYLVVLNDQGEHRERVLQNIVVKKVTTDFGTEVQEVWKVFLGN